MSNLGKRVVTAIIFVGIGITGILLHPFSFLALIFILKLLMLREFYTIVKSKISYPANVRKASLYFNHAISAFMFLLFVLIAYGILPDRYFILMPVFFLCFFMYELFSKSDHPFTNISINLIGLIYITIPLSMLVLIIIQGEIYRPYILIGILLLVWANDIFAYFVGSSIGKTKLLPRISPGKTVEGFAGGAFGTLGVAYVLSLFIPEFLLWEWIIIGVIVFIFGPVGDLVESMLKRSFNIKDSGSTLPGHGGFLDRFDAVIFVLPFIVAFVLMRVN